MGPWLVVYPEDRKRYNGLIPDITDFAFESNGIDYKSFIRVVYKSSSNEFHSIYDKMFKRFGD